MKDISWWKLFWLYIIAVFTLEIVLATFFSLQSGIIEIFPYLYILPILLLARTHPRFAIYFTVILGWIYLGLVFFFMPFEIRALASSVAWFYIFVTIGVMIASLTESTQQEKKFREMYDKSLAGIFTVDRESRTFSQVNERLASLLGYVPAELEGKEISLVFSEVKKMEAFFKHCSSVERADPLEAPLTRKDGDSIWALITASPLDERNMVCSVIDTTETKQIRDNLIESELRYHMLFDKATETILIHEPDGKILNANQTATRLSGYSLERLQEHRLEDLGLLPAGGLSSNQNTELQSKGHLQFESFLMTKEGVPLPVEVNSKIIEYEGHPAILSTVRDITNRRLAETALRESEMRYMMVGDLIPFGVWTCDEKGRYTYLSDSFLSLIGTTLEEANCNGWMHLLPREDRDRTLADWKQCIETGSTWDYEYRIVDTRKRTFIVLSRGAPHMDSSGKITSWVGIHLDITERKRYEERLESSLREKEVIIKEVHHRVKNNMQVISGFLELQTNYIDDPLAVEKLNECQQRVRTMALVHEKLYQAKNLGVINAGEYIRNLVADIKNSYSLATAVDIHVDVDDANMNLDMAIPCGLIINELVTNTLKYAYTGRPKGRLSVVLRHLPDHTFSLVVQDNGVGLPADFETRSRSSLGMQLVTVLIHQLGGTVKYENDNGARFTLVFPEKF